jgi:hypothetical protein
MVFAYFLLVLGEGGKINVMHQGVITISEETGLVTSLCIATHAETSTHTHSKAITRIHEQD